MQQPFRVFVILLSCCLWLADSQAAGAQELFWVSPTGDDTNSGSADSPWRSLAGARDNLRNGGFLDGDGDITVYFRGGIYVFDQTVVLSTADDGTPNQRISYAALPGETPVFTSLVQLTGWRTEGGSLMSADLPTGLTHVRYLQDASEPWMPRSATARFSTSEAAGGPDGGCVECNWDTPSTQPDRLNIQYPLGFDAPDWALANQYDLRQSTLPWHQELLPIQSVDASARRIQTDVASCFDMRADVQERPPQAWVLNSEEGITEPGEWASLNGEIILNPISGTDDIYVPRLTELVRLDDGTVNGNAEITDPVGYISFRGITFTGADFRITQTDDITGQHDWNVVDESDALLRLRNSSHITVENCTFTKSGGSGIRIDRYAQNILINDNDLSYLGKSGIVITGRGPGYGDVSRNNEIRNNRLERTGMKKWAAPAIVIDQSSHNHIHHNLIRNTYYTGIALTATRQLALGSLVVSLRLNSVTYSRRYARRLFFARPPLFDTSTAAIFPVPV